MINLYSIIKDDVFNDAAYLEAARAHDPTPKLYVWKQARCGFDTCTVCVPGREWFVSEKPSGRIVAKCHSFATALEFAAHYLTAEAAA